MHYNTSELPPKTDIGNFICYCILGFYFLFNSPYWIISGVLQSTLDIIQLLMIIGGEMTLTRKIPIKMCLSCRFLIRDFKWQFNK